MRAADGRSGCQVSRCRTPSPGVRRQAPKVERRRPDPGDGEIKIVPTPEGTRGYDDLRRAARREPLGEGIRPSVASPGDLVRMLAALGRDHDTLGIETMRYVAELDRGRGRER